MMRRTFLIVAAVVLLASLAVFLGSRPQQESSGERPVEPSTRGDPVDLGPETSRIELPELTPAEPSSEDPSTLR